AALASAGRATLTPIGAVAAERIGEVLAVHPEVRLDPPVSPPASRARAWTRADALVELLRGRFTIVGPVTAAALASSLSVTVADVDAALLALEGEGVILRGRFSFASTSAGGASAVEWCDRALLARIHRYTVARLRAEIEPVAPADF